MQYPHHLAIIADGNRTRAQDQWLPSMDGHFAGAKNTIDMLQYIFSTTPVEVVTGRFLSTENLKNRSQEELQFIFGIYKVIGNDLDEFLWANHINFRWVGDRTWIPADFLEFLDMKQSTFNFPDSKRTAVFALNYGWRDEIIRGIKSLSTDQINNLTEETFGSALDFWSLAPLDMVIRTKGDTAHRTSWFMTRRIWYAELYFSKEYYPAFTTAHLDEALKRYDSVAEKRNFGK